MISVLILVASALPDPIITGAAALCVLCGIILLGGHSVVRFPLRLLRSLKRGGPHRQAVASGLPSRAELE